MKGALIINKTRISFFIIIFYINITISIKREHFKDYIYFLSKITIKINTSGNPQQIFSSSFNKNYYPSSIVINNIEQPSTKIGANAFDLTEKSNIIELTWNTALTNCQKMFYNCDKIEEVDLSQFIGKGVTKYNNMFEDCVSLTSVNLSNLDTSSALDMSYMFLNCSKITSLDLSSFNTYKVTNMNFMFSGCKSLKYINVSSFDSSRVQYMVHMFHNCTSLESLDLSNFNTPSLLNFSFMFAESENLTYINLNKFNTSKVVEMKRVFFSCKSLISLNLSSFDTSKTTGMISMFYGCENLISLDLSSFNTTILRNINGMFRDCKSLISLNLSHFIAPSINDIAYLFQNNYNLKYLDISNLGTVNVTDMTESFSNCYSLKTLDLSNFNTSKTTKMKQMFQNSKSLIYLNLSNFDTSKVVDMTNMFNNCENLRYINLKNSKDSDGLVISGIFTNTPDKMSFCVDETLNKKIYDIIILDKPNSVINCSDDAFIYIPEMTIPTTIPITIPKTIPIKIPTTIPTIIPITIPATFPTTINTINKMINTIMSIINEPINYNCSIIDSINKCIFENIKNNDELYNYIINYLLKQYNNEDKIIEGKDNIVFQITNSEKQKSILKNTTLINNNQNLSIIDLATCEDILKAQYNISSNDSLIILKQENTNSNLKSSEKNIQYEIFEPYNKTKLNISFCEKTTINLYTKMTFSEKNKKMYQRLKELGYDMFNINDKFYQDICTPYKTENSTDILLSDRIDYIYNNEDTQCQINCQFSEYLLDTQYIQCECSVNGENKKNKKEKFTAKKIYESFYEVLKYSNYQVYKCYNLVFIKQIIYENFGGIIIFSYFAINIGCFAFYLYKKDTSLKNEIINMNKKNNKVENKDDIVIVNKDINPKKNDEKISFPPKKKIKVKVKIKARRSSKTTLASKKILDEMKLSNKELNFKVSDGNEPIKKKNIENSNISIYSKENINEKIKPENPDILKLDEINEINEVDTPSINLSDYELNELEYEEALKLDDRTFIQIYYAMLKRENIILFTFFQCRDYNLLYIKIARFIFLLATDMAMNVFFFSDDSMHKLFLSYGKYDFIQQIPQIVYSTIISQIFEIFLCYLSMTDKYIYQIKGMKLAMKEIMLLFKCINIKLMIFFSFNLLMFSFYWYSVASFCAVYGNSQAVFIKDSFTSFSIGIAYSFVIYLTPSALRRWAIKNKKMRLKFIYKLSELIPLF